MNLKDYAKKDIHKTEKEKVIPKELEATKDKYGDLINEFLSRYGKMDQQQMMQEMFKLVQQKKQEGTFNAKEIKQTAQYIAPLLDDEQRSYMYDLLNYLE